MAGNEFVTGYQAYETDTEESPTQFHVDDDEAPVLVHVRERTPTARWSHIENLDEFFTRVYTYHQRHGFLCMVAEDIFQLIQFVGIVLFTGFLIECVDYDILFATKTPETKQTFHEVIKTPCSCGFSIPAVAICMVIAFLFFFSQFITFLYNLSKYWEMKQFYNQALGIGSDDIDNKTWSEVQSKLMDAQREIQLCIYKNDLDPLDIHNRILRYKNYYIAMVNKSIIPATLWLPFVGEFKYMSHGLKATLEWILFWRPLAINISPFKDPYTIKDEFKNVHKRIQLSRELSYKILCVSVLCLVFSPVIFLWQILYLFFVYGSIVKNEPGFLGSRRWSLYARAHLRHFNELDHELNSRLCSAYNPSDEYLSGFMSPILSIVAKFVSFVAGAILVVLICLTVYDEDTLQIEHMLTLMTMCGLVVSMSRIFIPPENMVFVPETKMQQILAHIHYQPAEWKGYAHTSKVRDEFGQLFQLKAIFLLHELVSPFITPFILLFKVRSKSLEIVDFYRNFSVDVAGVGDVCSFAQLDIRKHGNHKWSAAGGGDKYLEAEHGKTELSLMNFSVNNPRWEPPESSSKYLHSIRESAARDANAGDAVGNPLNDSVMGWSQARMGFSSLHMPNITPSMVGSTMNRSSGTSGSMRLMGAISQQTGPLTDQPMRGGMLDVMSRSGSLECYASGLNNSEYNSSEMSISVLYMHELRRRNALSQLGQTGYENLEDTREVMSESELHPVPHFSTIDEHDETMPLHPSIESTNV